MNSLPNDAMNAEAQFAAPAAGAIQQEINILTVASLGCQRAAYWANHAIELQYWMAGGGFAQEAVECSQPTLDFTPLPAHPALRDFYADSTNLLARVRAASAAIAVRIGKT